MKNRLRTLLILGLIIFLFLFLWLGQFDCLFKKHFHFPCPGCGMNRAFNEILSFNILESFKYNILAFPGILIGLFCFGVLCYDLLKGTNVFLPKLFEILKKYYLVIFLIVFVSWMFNIYRGI